MASSEGLDPHLIREKKSRLIDAVVHNNVELLKELLDSPKWYNTTDNWGCNLLQIAIFEESKEVFDYLLTLPNYPLKFENTNKGTALEISLSPSPKIKKEYFACELIKKGACIDKISKGNFSYPGDTLLHAACIRDFVKTSMLLIEKGIDVNACGYKNYTPLQSVCKFGYCFSHPECTKLNEIIFMLLEFGADPSIRDCDGYIPFEDSVRYSYPNEMQEALFYYTFDKFSLLEIHLDILLKLAERNSPLFYEIIKQKFEIIVETNQSTVNSFFDELGCINLTNLKTLITKYEKSFKIFFKQFSEVNFHFYIEFICRLSIEILNVLIESSLKDEIVNVINRYVCSFLPKKINHLYKYKLTEYICYLLSYGIEIDECILCLIYKKFGYCDLFKILLHMDIKKKNYSCSSYILPRLLINITENLEDVFNSINNISFHQHRELISYFAHSKLLSMYREEYHKENINVPKVPSLLELSRNVFRSYFINKFQIKTSRKFYTLLNRLEISPVYKKFITYERKLYSL